MGLTSKLNKAIREKIDPWMDENNFLTPGAVHYLCKALAQDLELEWYRTDHAGIKAMTNLVQGDDALITGERAIVLYFAIMATDFQSAIEYITLTPQEAWVYYGTVASAIIKADPKTTVITKSQREEIIHYTGKNWPGKEIVTLADLLERLKEMIEQRILATHRSKA